VIKHKRHRRILAALRARGIVSVDELCDLVPTVSRVTIRRDIAELAARVKLRRTRGGAAAISGAGGGGDNVLPYPGPTLVRDGDADLSLDDIDAIVLPPIEGRGVEALRRQIRRRGLPFVAESAPQEGGVYVGPDDECSAFKLGRFAGRQVGRRARLVCLLITHGALANTTRRTDAFEQGLVAECAAETLFLRADGLGTYKSALAVALDAFAGHEDIDVVYGVNDHCALAGLDAAERSARQVRVYASGGERPDFVARVAGDGPLVAVSALFPSVVGAAAIDTVRRLLDGESPDAVYTPTAIVSAGSLSRYYAVSGGGTWALRPDVETRLIEHATAQSPHELASPPPAPHAPRAADADRRRTRRRPRVAFMAHFPAHDWYRTMFHAMRRRASERALDVTLAPPHTSIAAELARLRRVIARAALAQIEPGETIIIGEGAATLALAEALADARRTDLSRPAGVGESDRLTVVTNSLDVLERLSGLPGLRTVLTAGELQSGARYLVGPSLGALFECLRADRAFLSVAGVSRSFGLSTSDERRALAGSRFIGAARTLCVLADHTLIGAAANHRIAPLGEVDILVTDDGSLPLDRQTLRSAGIDVLVAPDERTDAPPSGESATTPPGAPPARSRHHVTGETS